MKLILFLLILSSLRFSIFAQEYFEDINFTFQFSKFEKKIHDYPEIERFYPFADGHGIYPDLSKLPNFPKKVAIISFDTWDNAIVNKNMNPETIWSGKDWVVDQENTIAYEMHRFGLPYIKDVFDSNNVTIITPDNFNEEQFNVYASFHIDYSKNYKKFVADSVHFDLCAAPGYRFIKKPINELDTKASDQLGRLAEQLGVDAVLIIENTIETTPYYGILKRVEFSLYGLNPNYSASNNNINLKGMHYITSQIDINAIFCQFDNGNKVYENYSGYDRFVTLLSNHMIHEFNKRKTIQPKIH
jgi:hypothetical protein